MNMLLFIYPEMVQTLRLAMPCGLSWLGCNLPARLFVRLRAFGLFRLLHARTNEATARANARARTNEKRTRANESFKPVQIPGEPMKDVGHRT